MTHKLPQAKTSYAFKIILYLQSVMLEGNISLAIFYVYFYDSNIIKFCVALWFVHHTAAPDFLLLLFFKVKLSYGNILFPFCSLFAAIHTLQAVQYQFTE